MKNGTLFILSGPSGSGKTTLAEKILESKKFKERVVRSVSATTRVPRKGEKHGTDYFFISESMFRYKIRAGHFLEWEKIFNAYYGTLNKVVRQSLRRGKSVILCIDVKGAQAVVRKFPDACRIFIQPPSMAVLASRLKSRNTEADAEYQRRFRAAGAELAEAKNYDFVVVNEKLSVAVHDLAKIITAKLARECPAECPE